MWAQRICKPKNQNHIDQFLKPPIMRDSFTTNKPHSWQTVSIQMQKHLPISVSECWSFALNSSAQEEGTRKGNGEQGASTQASSLFKWRWNAPRSFERLVKVIACVPWWIGKTITMRRKRSSHRIGCPQSSCKGESSTSCSVFPKAKKPTSPRAEGEDESEATGEQDHWPWSKKTCIEKQQPQITTTP